MAHVIEHAAATDTPAASSASASALDGCNGAKAPDGALWTREEHELGTLRGGGPIAGALAYELRGGAQGEVVVLELVGRLDGKSGFGRAALRLLAESFPRRTMVLWVRAAAPQQQRARDLYALAGLARVDTEGSGPERIWKMEAECAAVAARLGGERARGDRRWVEVHLSDGSDDRRSEIAERALRAMQAAHDKAVGGDGVAHSRYLPSEGAFEARRGGVLVAMVDKPDAELGRAEVANPDDATRATRCGT